MEMMLRSEAKEKVEENRSQEIFVSGRVDAVNFRALLGDIYILVQGIKAKGIEVSEHLLYNSADMAPRAGFYSAKTLLTLTAVTLLFSASDTLNINIFQSPLQVLVNEDVLLGCKVSGFNTAELDLEYVAVQWSLVHEERMRNVYAFNEGNHSSIRPGARINEDDLRKGNASLYLPKIQINEEGQYICTVFYTPSKVQNSSMLQVSARPKINLSTERVTISNGSKWSVRCDVTGFYPRQLHISWEKLSQGKTESVASNDSGGELVSNDDGTFSKSSQISIAAPLEDDGNNYRCIVKHRSLPNDTIVEAELIVPETNSIVIIGAIIGVSVICALLAAGFCLYFRKYQKVPPPSLSELSCHPDAEPGKEVTLLCTISTLFPKEIEVQWYRDKVKIINGGNFGMAMEEVSSEGGLTKIIAKAIFIPVLDDNQVEYSIKVTHPRSSALPVEHSWNLILQEVSEITCSSEPGNKVTLSCCVRTKFPEEIEVKWYRGKETIERTNEDLMIMEELIQDGLYKTAKLTFTPATNDNLIEYRIQVVHRRVPSTPIERSFSFNLQVSEISFISNPQPKQEATLSSTITLFFPRKVEVQWFRGESRIENSQTYTMRMEEPASEQGLSKIAKLTFTPTPNDDQVKYTMKVSYPNIAMTPIERNNILDLKGTPPVVPKIICCSGPKQGKEVTLCCYIRAYFPKDIKVEWYRGQAIMEPNDKSGVTMEDCVEYAYFKFTELTFIANADDDQVKYTIKVTPKSSNTSPIERSFLLQF
ncbi:uncharacterized protein [Heptranchias perlo]|uniref:uncharacterized protein n=1 Tax=Heptranchias perlo TaxID=212740 RepID=UPI0035596F60